MRIRTKEEVVREVWSRLIVTGLALAFILWWTVWYIMEGGSGDGGIR